MAAATPHLTVSQASAHLWEALSHHAVTLDLGANDPLVRAISAYGAACREQDEAQVAETSGKVYRELSHYMGNRDLAANDPVVKALAEYGDACRHEGRKS